MREANNRENTAHSRKLPKEASEDPNIYTVLDGELSGSYVAGEGWVEQSGKLQKQKMEFKTNGVAPTTQRQREVEPLRSSVWSWAWLK